MPRCSSFSSEGRPSERNAVLARSAADGVPPFSHSPPRRSAASVGSCGSCCGEGKSPKRASDQRASSARRRPSRSDSTRRGRSWRWLTFSNIGTTFGLATNSRAYSRDWARTWNSRAEYNKCGYMPRNSAPRSVRSIMGTQYSDTTFNDISVSISQQVEFPCKKMMTDSATLRPAPEVRFSMTRSSKTSATRKERSSGPTVMERLASNKMVLPRSLSDTVGFRMI
mmetsp:Transcript_7488/g.18896  ORF Transcript_7488/g.18896 Transcript_7488/m.18896 type:complete len:225 (+) Transcript_7488:330-1004(+)